MQFSSRCSLVGGAFVGIAFAASGIPQDIQDMLIPEGTIPIAGFITKPTSKHPRINATSATFAETAPTSGYISYCINMIGLFMGGFDWYTYFLIEHNLG